MNANDAEITDFFNLHAVSSSSCVIVRVRVVLKRTAVDAPQQQQLF